MLPPSPEWKCAGIPAECRLRSCCCRFKSGGVAKARRSAVSLDLLRMDFQDFIKRQKRRLHKGGPTTSIGQLLECLSVSLVRPLLGSVELLPPRRGCRGCDDQLSPIGTNIERRFVIDLEEVQDRAVNYQRQTVSVLGKLLDHAHLRTSNVSPHWSLVEPAINSPCQLRTPKLENRSPECGV